MVAGVIGEPFRPCLRILGREAVAELVKRRFKRLLSPSLQRGLNLLTIGGIVRIDCLDRLVLGLGQAVEQFGTVRRTSADLLMVLVLDGDVADVPDGRADA